MTTVMKRCLWCAVLFAAAGTLTAGPGTWKNYTSMSEVRAFARSGGTFWVGTSGGIFGWTPSTGAYQTYTNAEGLMNIDVTALAVDRSGRIWSGTSSGVIHILTPSDGSIQPVLDIARSSSISKQINTLTAFGDTLLIGTAFGLSVYRTDRLEFGDTFDKFGTGTQGIRFSVKSAIRHEGKLWACITDGQTINRVAVGDLSLPNLLAPESWILESPGLSGEIPSALASFNGLIYAGTSGGLYVRTGGTWSAVAGTQGYAVAGLAATSSSLAIAARSLTTQSQTLLSLSNQGVLTTVASNAPFALTGVTTDSLGAPVAASTGGGILLPSEGWSSHIPSGPNSNQFIHLDVTQEGVLWTAAGPLSPAGFSRFNGKEWKSFTTATSPILNNGYHRVSVDNRGGVWLSSFGRGLVEVPPGSDTVTSSHVYYTDVGMVGLPNDPLFIVPGNVVCDGAGNYWSTVILPVNRKGLVVRTAGGTWRVLPTYVNGGTVSTLFDTPVDKELALDANDNLWAVCRDPNARGVISLGNAGSVDSTASVLVTSSNGLPSDDVRTIVTDRDNDIWVGTDKGIGIILDPSNPKRQGGIAAYKPLTGLVINTITVDPLNQKWVGTNEGAVLLSPDGTQVLANYTVENTGGKIINNDIRAIGVDPKSGTVYFGTLSGLSSVTTSAVAPRTAFEELKVYPNPYRIPSEIPLTVDGLVENSALKVLTVDGRLVRDVRTPGGRIGFWDGKDNAGNVVPSGIYIIVATDEGGEQVANGKVAVLRK